jgi:hypothetical protein
MESADKPNIVFQQSVFGVEKIKEKWPHLERLITSRDLVTAALERTASSPRWQRDPLLANIAPATANEVLAFYNTVVADGRYVAELPTDARGVAKKLNYAMSDVAFDTMKSIVLTIPEENPAVVIAVATGAGIAIAGGLAITTATASGAVDPRKQIVIDESGIVKI